MATQPAAQPHALDSYVVWHSPAGHHGLHGPYPYDIAQQLVRYAPAGSVVVKSAPAVGDHFRFVEVLLFHVADKVPAWRAGALHSTGIRHAGSDDYSAVTVALEHVLAGVEHITDPGDIATALVEAGFTPRR